MEKRKDRIWQERDYKPEGSISNRTEESLLRTYDGIRGPPEKREYKVLNILRKRFSFFWLRMLTDVSNLIE